MYKTEQFQKGSEHLQVNWDYAVGAGVVGALGVGFLWAGATKKNQKTRTYCYTVGIMSLVIAVILGTQILTSEPKKRKVEKLEIKQPYMGAIQGMMSTLASRLPASIRLNPTFFPNAQVCMRDGEKVDGIFAYDFTGKNSNKDYLLLKDASLKKNGLAIRVGKEGPDDNKMQIPFFERAEGPRGILNRFDWTCI